MTTRYEIRLNATKRALTDAMLKEIVRENNLWTKHKHDCVQKMMRVLNAPSARHRQRRVLKYFDESNWRTSKYDQNVLSALPRWLVGA
jgi:hypothetical protein